MQKPLVRRVVTALQRRGYLPQPWYDAFRAGTTFVDSLATQLGRNDFFVLILTPDDHIRRDNQSIPVVRDNVVFEAGAAFGRHGLTRTILIRENTVDGPSDLRNVNVIKFDFRGGSLSDEEVNRITSELATTIERTINDEKVVDHRIRWLSFFNCAPFQQDHVIKLVESRVRYGTKWQQTSRISTLGYHEMHLRYSVTITPRLVRSVELSQESWQHVERLQ